MTDAGVQGSRDSTAESSPSARFQGFTEASYARLLDLVAERFAFEPFGTTSTSAHVLWRHDIDFSVHRAVALARLESERHVRSTFFVLLHSPFYSPFERDCADRLEEISRLGHAIGLHFEAGFYGAASPGELADHLAFERMVLERIVGTPVTAFSFHNPELDGTLSMTDDHVADMISAYGASIRDRYRYVSDSNGIWRHDELASVVAGGKHRFLHVLTHPEWWTPTPLSPRDRISRCIDGRAARNSAYYDELIARSGRPNVR
jgi:hypothetical protein